MFFSSLLLDIIGTSIAIVGGVMFQKHIIELEYMHASLSQMEENVGRIRELRGRWVRGGVKINNPVPPPPGNQEDNEKAEAAHPSVASKDEPSGAYFATGSFTYEKHEWHETLVCRQLEYWMCGSVVVAYE